MVIVAILNGGGMMYGQMEQLPAQAVGIVTPAALTTTRAVMIHIVMITMVGLIATLMAKC